MTRTPGRLAAAVAASSVLALGLGFAPTASATVAAPGTAPPSSDGAQTTLALPAPTGPHAVGQTTLDLVDADRADPWHPDQRREVMVSVWYPAVPRTGDHLAPYTTEAVSEITVAGFNETAGLNLPLDTLATVRTNAREDALPLPGRHPLVVVSPGAGLSRESLSTLTEDLASRGYVVAAVDHTYEAQAVEFPDGRVTRCELVCTGTFDDEAQLVAFFSQVQRDRAADVSFVIDELTGTAAHQRGHDRAGTHLPAVDARRIAMVGHSLGGAAVVSAMVTDDRVDAGVDLDGSVFDLPPATGLDRPFLIFSAGTHGPGSPDTTLDQTWARLTGERTWLLAPTMDHVSFADQAVLGKQLDLHGVFAPIDADRALKITRTYVAAFLDEHLRGIPTRLLDRPSKAFPEVQVVSP